MNQPPPYYGPYGPPPQKKGMGAGAIVAIVFGSIFGGLVLIGALASIGDSDDRTDAKPTRTAVAAAPPATKSPTAPSRTAAAKPKATAAGYGDGDYLIGEDIPPGTYETPGAQAGIFEFCMVSTKPADGGLGQMRSANKDERIIITITKDDTLLTVSGCEPLKRRK